MGKKCGKFGMGRHFLDIKIDASSSVCVRFACPRKFEFLLLLGIAYEVLVIEG
jgi:hypothetical protein